MEDTKIILTADMNTQPVENREHIVDMQEKLGIQNIPNIRYSRP